MGVMLVKRWLFLLTIPAIEGSLRLGKPQGFSGEERVMDAIQETCYGDNDFKDLIFILGDFNEVFDEASVIRMNNFANVDEEYESRQLLSIGVTKVLIIEDSPERLYSDLMSFKKTRWWNNMLPFFIIGKNDEKCENFNEMLITTWRMDIINSIYICSESENTTLYTLNPITNYAPNPWKRMKDLNDSNVYHQVFDLHTSCNNLNYDKTKVLNWYPIRFALSEPPYAEIDPSNRFNAIPLLYLQDFMREQLTTSITFEMLYRDDPSYYIKERQMDVIFYDLRVAKDITGSSLYFLKNIQCVVVVKSNARTVLFMIRHLWRPQVLCISAILLIILYFILKMKNDEVTSAILDVIRFFICVSIRTETRSNSFRIYFASMLMFIVITNGVFQGEIAAFLTKSDQTTLIRTVKELNDLGYHFYVNYGCARMSSRLNLSKSNVKVIDHHLCIDHHVLNGTLNACIIPLCMHEDRYMSTLLSHITPQVEILHSYSWTSRRNWPIYERFNSMLMQIFECNIPLSDVDIGIRTMQNRDKINDHELALATIQSSYRPIDSADLNLAFKFLAIGLSFAMFALIVELRIREI